MCLQRGTGKPQALAAEPLAFLWGGPRRQMKAVCQGRRPFFRTYRYPVAGVSVLTDRQANTRNIHAVPAHSRADPPWRVFLCWPKVLQRRRKRMRARRHRDRRTGGRADGQTHRQASRQASAQDRPGAARDAHFPVVPCRPLSSPCRPLRKFLSSPVVPIFKKKKILFPFFKNGDDRGRQEFT